MAARLQRLRRGSLRETFTFAGPAFRRAAPWLLGAVLLAGIATRIHPAIRFAVWGSDSGEYLFLTERLVDTGRITFDYEGWGLAYPYFPGMFVLSGAVSAITGVDIFYATQWTTPILGGLLGVLIALLTYRVTSDPRAGILAGAFVAVSSLLVLTTSHAMPGALGQVLLLGILVLLPDAYRDRGNLVILGLLALALLVTHHLSTYFAIGILAFIPFYREMTQSVYETQRLKVEIPFVLALLVAAMVWWLGVAKPFRDEIVGDALPFPPLVNAVLFLLALAALPTLVILSRTRPPWHIAPRYAGFPRQRAYVLGGIGLFAGILLAVVLFKLPGSDIDIGWPTFVYGIPLILWLAFLPLGVGAMRFHRHGTLVIAWLYAILGSLAFAVVTNSHVLFPFRHVDYMGTAMAPIVAVGMLMVYDQTLASRIPSERPRVRSNMLAAFAALLLLTAALSLPPRETLGGFEEGTTRAEMDAVEWADRNLREGTTIAADHRLSSLLFGVAGLHATWDFTPMTYHSETAPEALQELRSVHVPPRDGEARVDYVVLSPPIEEGVTLLQWETSRPMSEAAIAKFDDTRVFEKVYDERDVRIYRIKWEALAPGV